MIQIGYKSVGIFDEKYERSIIEFGRKGECIFNGKVFLGSGTKLCVSGMLEFGENVNISGNTSVICYKNIKIGNDCLVSWDCLVMDTDFHKIYSDGILTNSDKKIEVGNHVWIGARSTILKGSIIPDGSVIGAGAVCCGKFAEKNCIYGGNPLKILKQNICWES